MSLRLLTFKYALLQEMTKEEEGEGEGKRRSRSRSRRRPGSSLLEQEQEWDASPLGRSNSVATSSGSRPPEPTRRATSETDSGKQKVKATEVIYYTARLKEIYDRSDTDVTSKVASGQKLKYLDQLKDQLQIGQKEPPLPKTAVVPYDPTGLKKKLIPLGKEGLMELIVNLAKKLEEAGKSAEIQRLLDIVSARNPPS